jgi:hypothetical protein
VEEIQIKAGYRSQETGGRKKETGNRRKESGYRRQEKPMPVVCWTDEPWRIMTEVPDTF